MRATPARSKGLSEITLWCERKLQGGRNSGRVVAKQEQRRLRAAVGERAQEVERRRVGPMQVLESEDNRLRPRPSQNQGGHRRQLPAPQLLRREAGRAIRRQRNVYERREQGRVFRRVEADQPQRVLEICEALLGRSIHTKALPAPFGDWMQRRVLQKLRSAPLAPGMRRLSQAANGTPR